jgi:hypothetical protein
MKSFDLRYDSRFVCHQQLGDHNATHRSVNIAKSVGSDRFPCCVVNTPGITTCNIDVIFPPTPDSYIKRACSFSPEIPLQINIRQPRFTSHYPDFYCRLNTRVEEALSTGHSYSPVSMNVFTVCAWYRHHSAACHEWRFFIIYIPLKTYVGKLAGWVVKIK